MEEAEIKKFFIDLGFTEEEYVVYITLFRNGEQSLFELSKNTNLNRTTLYRIVEEMQVKGLIEEVMSEEKKVVKAVSYNKIKLKIDEMDFVVRRLKGESEIVENLLNNRFSASQPGTKILFYKGIEGLKQLLWNTLSTNTIVYGLFSTTYSNYFDEKYINRRYDEIKSRNVKYKYIVSSEYVKEMRTKYPDIWKTDLLEKRWEIREIKSNIFKIRSQINIYNDVFVIYNWNENDIFGVEIYNKEIAEMQRDYFEVLWRQAERAKA